MSDGTVCGNGNVCTGGVCVPPCAAGGVAYSIGQTLPGSSCTVCTAAGWQPQSCTASTTTADGGVASFVIPAIDPSVATTVAGAASFLYTGADGGAPVQTGVDAGAISAGRVGVVRGSVSDPSGKPLPGVGVTVLGHPEFGQTTTLSDGSFDLAVNGGGSLIVAINAPGYIPVQRTIAKVPWNGYVLAGSVVMTPVDTVGTPVQLPSPSPQIARGTLQSDSTGSRTATLYVPSGTGATIATGNGAGAGDGGTSVSTLTVHATEFTVGANGPAAMPGDLPANSGYTYAVEYSADEVPAGSHVQFSKPLISYTDNFLHMKTGERVPAGYYDRDRGQWVPSTDGLVIQILSIDSTGLASVDLQGNGTAAGLNDLQNVLGAAITHEELLQLGHLYAANTTLWRVPIPHFTPWDFNWPFGPPGGSGPPPVPRPVPPGGGPGGGGGGPGGPPPPPPSCSETCCDSAPPGDGAKYNNGSYIECYTGVLHETIPIAGTPYHLTYSSDRVVGYGVANRLEVPVTSSAPVPSTVTGIEMQVDVAGTSTTQSFSLPAPANQIATFDWNGSDAFGRYLQGRQTATVSVGYTYPGVYLSAKPQNAAYDATFDHFSYYGTPATGDRTRQTVTLWSRTQMPIGHWAAEGLRLGGWTLDVQDVYDPTAHMLLLGDGSRQSGDVFGQVISTVVGSGTSGYSPDGTATRDASLYQPVSVAVLPDGSLLIAERANCVIRKVSGGVLSTVAGVYTSDPTSRCGYNGDNQPATHATLRYPESVVAAPDGSFYIADTGNQIIRHVGLDGTIALVAGVPPGQGDPNATYGGDGLSATSPKAKLQVPRGVALAKDGSLYFSDANSAVRKVDPSGILSTVWRSTVGKTGFFGPLGVAQSADGDIYVAERDAPQVTKIDLAGNISAFAGKGHGFHGIAVGGVPATQTDLNHPGSLAVARDGTVYIFQGTGAPSLNGNNVLSVASDGILRIVAGIGAAGYSGDKGAAVNARLNPFDLQNASGLALSGDDQTLYIADAQNNVVRAISLGQPGFSNTNFSVAATSGAEVYQFGAQGQHLRTLSLPTNTPRVKLGYTNGLVTSITDADNNVTKIQRDSSGTPVSIVSPLGVTTGLHVGTDGYLANVVGPTGQYNVRYNTGGLLATLEYPTSTGGQFVSSKSYDSLGRVVTTSDAAGHSLTLNRSPDALSSVTLSKKTSAGVTTNLAAQVASTGATTWTATYPDRTTTGQLQRGVDGRQTRNAPDGTLSVATFGPDPRFGMQAPITATQTITVPGAAPDGGAVTETIASNRTVVLSDPSDPLSLVSQTDTTQISGFQPATTTYYADGGVFVATSPMGRTTVTYVNQPGQNGAGQPAETFVTSQSGGSLQPPEIAPTVIQYNALGQVFLTQQGTFPADAGAPRAWQQGYDPQGYLQSTTDPSGSTTTYSNDLAGNPVDTYLPGGPDGGALLPDGGARDLHIDYDSDGNPRNVTLPSGSQHGFTYTPVDALATYSPPAPDGGTAGNWSTTNLYDADGRLFTETRPDGSQITYAYDPVTGQLKTKSYTQPNVTGTRSYGYTYDPATGHPKTLSAPSGEVLTYAFGGSLSTGVTWSGGPVSGQLAFGYDNALRLISQTLNGTALAFGYDQDNLMTSAGAEVIGRDMQNGRVTGTTLGAVTDVYSYDGNGQLASYTASYNATIVYSETINTRDATGRIKQRTETSKNPSTGSTDTYVWTYGYDPAGRLTMAQLDANGATRYVRQYGYDADDNRSSLQDTSTGAAILPTYDAQDRLVAYAGTAYGYGANGELQTKTDATGTTSYVYDVFGNLLTAQVPQQGGSKAIAYIVDGQNRRVGTQVNGALTSGFLYQDQLRVVAQFSPSGNVVARFVFGSKPNVPDYYTDPSGNTYRIFSDHLGSPRLIVNTATGAIVEEVQYDEFGNVMNETQPVVIPFGFAGGLRDLDTGLVRFGARDYDPAVGRWTSKDPTRFAGGMNLYGYVVNDPIDLNDPAGRAPCCDSNTPPGQFCSICWAPLPPPPPPAPEPPPICPKPAPAGQFCPNSGSGFCNGNFKQRCSYSCVDGTECAKMVACPSPGYQVKCPDAAYCQ